MAERIAFSVHEAMIRSVIQNQGGTIQKAIMEAVMNSIDAGATSIAVTISNDSFTVTDNGRGMGTKEDIKRFFAVFAQPHTDGDAIHGRFRLGRGQIMYFGRCEWRSGRYSITTDVMSKERGLDSKGGFAFNLERIPERQDGCVLAVSLYDTMNKLGHNIDAICVEIAACVLFCEVDITVNDVSVKQRRADLLDKCTKLHDDENVAVYRRTSDGGHYRAKLYNLGILAEAWSSLVIKGAAGTHYFAAKKRLEMNTARNSVMSRCPVMEEIRKVASKLVDSGAVPALCKDADSITRFIDLFADMNDKGNSTEATREAVTRCRWLHTISGKRMSLTHIADGVSRRRNGFRNVYVMALPAKAPAAMMHAADRMSQELGVVVLDPNVWNAFSWYPHCVNDLVYNGDLARSFLTKLFDDMARYTKLYHTNQFLVAITPEDLESRYSLKLSGEPYRSVEGHKYDKLEGTLSCALRHALNHLGYPVTWREKNGRKTVSAEKALTLSSRLDERFPKLLTSTGTQYDTYLPTNGIDTMVGRLPVIRVVDSLGKFHGLAQPGLICIDKNLADNVLSARSNGAALEAIMELVTVLVHEVAHFDVTNGFTFCGTTGDVAAHDADFHERFHDLYVAVGSRMSATIQSAFLFARERVARNKQKAAREAEQNTADQGLLNQEDTMLVSP